MKYLTQRYKHVQVAYLPHLDGGGRGFGQCYIPVVKKLFGKVDRVFEFCAGPGFIGFSLLAHGLCDSLCLADINPEAVEAAKWTVRRNNLGARVKVYLSDCLDQIPDSERWDLVVSNPPHFKDAYQDSIRHHDPNWIIHQKFYSGVARFLKPGGSVLIQENYEGSVENDFTRLIKHGGLEPDRSFMYGDPSGTNYFDSYYFIWSHITSTTPIHQALSASSIVSITSDSAETIDVALNDGQITTIKLKKLTPYRFLFSNKLGRPVKLMVYAKKFGIIPRFLRTFGTIGCKGRSFSFVFQFYAGEYLLRDSQSGGTLCHIRAS
jgi:SAM-dependent methyltransferase